MYSDMTVTGEERDRERERGRGETQPGQWVGACFQKKCRRPSEAICDFLNVSFWLDSATIWAAVDFFFCLFLLVEPRRRGEREEWVGREWLRRRKVSKSILSLLVGFLFSVLFIFLLTKFLYQVDKNF